MFWKVVGVQETKKLIVAALLCLYIRAIASGDILGRSAQWYDSDEAVQIADNVLLYQRNTGGWPKGIDLTRKLSEDEKQRALRSKDREDSTLDNRATHTQIRFLASVHQATGLERFKQGCLKGLDYLLEAQYPNGGWPQRYPKPGGYSRYITFNDGAMIGAMTALREVAKKQPRFAFVDEDRRSKAEKAVQKGIECILKCQIIVDGKRTVWCQQHDEKTFEPRPARIYEKVSLCGCESVGIVRFLMGIEEPPSEIVEAIQGAIEWFERVKLEGIRQAQKPDNSERGFDKVIIKDPSAPRLWARFYEMGTNRPIFCGRDGIVKYSLAEIEQERRTGYAWYGDWPTNLLNKDYPAWQKKIGRQ